jgi:hypothetical protein
LIWFAADEVGFELSPALIEGVGFSMLEYDGGAAVLLNLNLEACPIVVGTRVDVDGDANIAFLTAVAAVGLFITREYRDLWTGTSSASVAGGTTPVALKRLYCKHRIYVSFTSVAVELNAANAPL